MVNDVETRRKADAGQAESTEGLIHSEYGSLAIPAPMVPVLPVLPVTVTPKVESRSGAALLRPSSPAPGRTMTNSSPP